ncbi:MAG: hypothetical protein F6J87_30680, partial [Spirulina sp. SIO3F2]|nr:hypothetical protein [Spirulina sp. SIO3F2]
MPVDPNQEALEELAFALEAQIMSHEFYLVLALCNSGNLRDRLSKRLIKTCDLSETQVTLPPESRGLYGFLHMTDGEGNAEYRNNHPQHRKETHGHKAIFKVTPA